MHLQTIVDQVEVERDGHVKVRFSKLVVNDDGSVHSSSPHRVRMPPGHDVDAQMAAVNVDLQTNHAHPPVDDAEVDAIVRPVCAAVWTPGRVKAHQEREAAERAALIEQGERLRAEADRIRGAEHEAAKADIVAAALAAVRAQQGRQTK